MDPTRNLRRSLSLAPLGLLLAAASLLGADAVVDQSYVARTGERVIQQSYVVDGSVERVWDLFTTAEGLRSWAAPEVEVDLRIGGSIRSNFKVGSAIGEPGTVVSEIVSLVPEREIVVRDDLVRQLTMGGLFDWLDVFPQEFLTELEREGDDLFSTIRFEPLPDGRTRVTIFAYGYGEGEQWDRVFGESKKSNDWFLGNLSKRLEKGPIEWSKQ